MSGVRQTHREQAGTTLLMAADAGPIEALALWFSGPRKIEFRQETIPPPAAGQLRISAIASAPSHGSELLVYRGEVQSNLELDLPTLAGSFGFPIKYGYAAVGRVLDVGPGVGDVAPGDLVFVHHPHQSVFLVARELVTRLPNGVVPELGVFTANLETAVNVVLDAGPRLGETALVFGLGTVGLLVGLLLRRAGASRLLAVDPLPIRRALGAKLGLEALDPGPDLPAQVRKLTDGRGADLAVEASGSADALQAAIESVVVEGTVVVASWYGLKDLRLSLGGHFHRGRVRLRSSQVGRLDPALAPRWDRRRRLEQALGLLTELPLAELITHRFPFAEAPAAYSLLDERPGEAVQVVFTYG
jgi:2-desacetyl-2-hydroxyethyl bacteriochlorophyllide A dehydrogenase